LNFELVYKTGQGLPNYLCCDNVLDINEGPVPEHLGYLRYP
jgi:hypothetical protein